MARVAALPAAPEQNSAAGAAIYSRPVLAFYDWYVLGVSNQLWWKCPTAEILAFYSRHISANHLDIGVGTGYFLDTCQYPQPEPAIVLADLNVNSLGAAAQRIRRYSPASVCLDILAPLPFGAARFDSIGINYLLHCLAGPMVHKEPVLANLRPLLRPEGVLFGTTILGQGVPQNWLARRVMKIYNQRGIFGNTTDSREELEAMLGRHYGAHEVRVVGCVAFFWARP